MSRSPIADESRGWLWAICAIAALQIAFGLAGLAVSAAGVEWCRPTAVLDWHRAVAITALGGLAAYMLLGGRRDRRVEILGAHFLLLAVFYAHPPIEALTNALPEAWARLPRAIGSITIAALSPALLWLFCRDFPRALEWPRSARFAKGMIGLSFATGALLIAANLAIGFDPGLGFVRQGCGADSIIARGTLAFLDPDDRVAFYWTAVFGLMIPVLPFMGWRFRHAPADERRRVRIFVLGPLLAALPPILLAILPSLSKTIEEFVLSEWASAVLIPLNLLMILSMAAIAAYSVVVEQVLDVRTLLRKAAQYWLARIVVGTVAVTPFALLIAMLYGARLEPLAALFEGTRPIRLLGLLALGVLAIRLSGRATIWVDRLFFRESHDARRVLAQVAERTRDAESSAALADVVIELVDRALHVESAGLLVARPDLEYAPLAGALRRLPTESRLAALLHEHPGPLEVDLSRPNPRVQSLDDADRVWLADAGAQMLVPLTAATGSIPGILVLGPKRSELPFSREDTLLLSALGGTVGVALENRMLRASAASAAASARATSAAAEEQARECPACGLVSAAGSERCPECSESLRDIQFPQDLFGKFRLERRVGAGAMGVVYQARDLTLDRAVALKTLPRTSPENSARLRREARAMAAITHPNLALIHGAETWEGIPILVIEYLAGGTLAAQVESAPLGLLPALELGVVMARVLETAHAAGILHRDVKPTNIGFTHDGVPKLLDFGLARIAEEAGPLAEPSSLGETGIAGTPLYMSPEALQGRRPEPGFDLWGAAVVVFEAACGRHPFEYDDAAGTFAAIRRGWDDKVADRLGPAPEAVIKQLSRALARERARRPVSASELEQDLQLAAESLR